MTREQAKHMMTSEADGTFTISEVATGKILGRMNLDDFDIWRAWSEDAEGQRVFLGEFEDDGDASAAIVEASQEQ